MLSPRKYKTTLAIFALCLAAAVAAPAQTFTLLDSLNSTIGSSPSAPLIQGIDGNLYGAASGGGLKQDGTVFRVTPGGTLSLVHYFHGADGQNPTGLVLETNGNLYGTTASGGTNSCGSAGCGTVFGFTSKETLFTLHSFDGNNGQSPLGGLTLGPDGRTFYGTTSETADQCGNVFTITATGTFTVLASFDCVDGISPAAPLVLGTDGNLYGTTHIGGQGPQPEGTVFKIGPDTSFETLHNFNATDGEFPAGALVEGRDGNFYGVTNSGGTSGFGTVFVISPDGRTFRTLNNFNGTNGNSPTSLVLGADGNFYGTTSSQVNIGSATIFKITPAGVLTTLHTFDSTEGGGSLTLMQHTNGTFYGTTSEFGANGDGTVFSLSTGLGPFVNAVPARRGIGARVLLLGQGFTGTTSVMFNGVPATFTVNSDTEIVTIVPTGATKGFIVVTTPSGTVSTKVFFTVG